MTRPDWRRWAWLALAALPAVVTAIYVARYHLGLPYWDGWELAPDVQRLRAGALTLAELWRPHNEHRLFLPRLIMLGLAALTRWNDADEVAVSFLLATGAALLLTAQWRRSAARLAVTPATPLVPLITLLVYALTQWENWVWGWQLIFYLEALFAMATVLLVAQWAGRWPRLLGAGALALAASVSLSLGLLLWPVGLLVLLVSGWLARVPGRQLATAAVAWALAGAATYAIYFTGMTGTNAGGLLAALGQPMAYAHYVLNFLGAAVVTYDYAFLAGGAGLAAWLASVVVLARRHWGQRDQLAALLPLAAPGLWVIAAALLIGASRLPFGTHQAIASRYVTLSYPFWVSMAALLYLAAEPAARTAAQRWARAGVHVGLVGLTALVILCSAVGGLLGYYWRYLPAQQVRAAALSGQVWDDALLQAVYPNPSIIRPSLDYLRSERLSLFAGDDE